MNEILNSHVEFPPIVGFKQRAKELTPEPQTTYDLSQAVPAFPTFKTLTQKLAQKLETDPSLSFYTEIEGLLALRKAIVDFHPLKESLSPSQILITAGANHALFQALILNLNPGDAVALPEPYYFNHDMALKMLGFQSQPLLISEADRFELNAKNWIQQLEQDRFSKIKGLILVTPNNPTGATYKASELETLLEYCEQRKLFVILDETYLKFDPNHLNQPDLGRFLNQTLSLVGSFSKTYSLTGYRVGYWIVPQAHVKNALKIQDTSVICAPHLSQQAALIGLQHCEKELCTEIARIHKLKLTLETKTKDFKKFKILSAGAFFAYLKHPYTNLSSTDAALRLYQETGILGLPGSVFGASQEGYIRLSFCNLSAQKLEQMILALQTADSRFT